MGTDDLGRDLFSGVVHGTRTSTIIALGVGGLALIIGTLVGTVAGYRGGAVDDVLMRITEFFQVLPRFFVAILAVALFGAGLDRLVPWPWEPPTGTSCGGPSCPMRCRL
jgi:peptide/nickel transport system permease protein